MIEKRSIDRHLLLRLKHDVDPVTPPSYPYERVADGVSATIVAAYPTFGRLEYWRDDQSGLLARYVDQIDTTAMEQFSIAVATAAGEKPPEFNLDETTAYWDLRLSRQDDATLSLPAP